MNEIPSKTEFVIRAPAVRCCETCGRPYEPSKSGIVVNLYTGIASWNGIDINVARRESLLLDALSRVYPSGISHEALFRAMYGDPDDGGPAFAKDSHVSRLRSKITAAGWPYTIAVRRYLGYALIRKEGTV